MLLWTCVAWNLPQSSGSDLPQAANTSSPEDCQGAKGSLDRSFPGVGYNNPKPGVFYMPPIVWASASQENREVVAKLLALQKGCELGVDPNYVTVEVRSITDNRLLAEGMYWDLEEQ
jgi:hypothetical protein